MRGLKRLRTGTQHPITPYAGIITNERNEELNEILLDLVSTAIRTNVVEHPKFETLMKAFRPGFRAKDRKHLASVVLPRLYEKCQNQTERIMRDSHVATFMFDGWPTSRHAKGLENFMLYVDPQREIVF